jgi:signal transduction histidine kinase
MIDAAAAARTIASRKHVSITVSDLEEAAVTGDAMLLRQLTVILLDNAIKYTESHGTVSAGVHADGAMARLTIRDTGIGIPEEQLPHVFERFYRGDAARTRNGIGDTISEGAGLGLSIARWIVEEHGGVIGIESIVGRGTTVTVMLPLAEGAPRMAAT